MADIATLPVPTAASKIQLTVQPKPVVAPLGSPNAGGTLAAGAVQLNADLSAVEYGQGNYDVVLAWAASTATPTAPSNITSISFPAGTIPAALAPKTTQTLPAIVNNYGLTYNSQVVIGTDGSVTFNYNTAAGTAGQPIGLVASQTQWRILA